MLHRNDTLDSKVSREEAMKLISDLREIATDKSDMDGYHKWRQLMLAAAELERHYIRSGIISDARYVQYQTFTRK